MKPSLSTNRQRLSMNEREERLRRIVGEGHVTVTTGVGPHSGRSHPTRHMAHQAQGEGVVRFHSSHQQTDHAIHRQETIVGGRPCYLAQHTNRIHDTGLRQHDPKGEATEFHLSNKGSKSMRHRKNK